MEGKKVKNMKRNKVRKMEKNKVKKDQKRDSLMCVMTILLILASLLGVASSSACTASNMTPFTKSWIQGTKGPVYPDEYIDPIV